MPRLAVRSFPGIVCLTTVAAATLAFEGSGDLNEQIDASAVAVAIGIAIRSLLTGVAAWSVLVTAPQDGSAQPGLACAVTDVVADGIRITGTGLEALLCTSASWAPVRWPRA